MQEIIFIAIAACWIGEWSKIVQTIAWWTWSKLNWFACAKCWGFWIGLIIFYNTPRIYLGLLYYDFGWALWNAILCSALAMIFNKLYMRL